MTTTLEVEVPVQTIWRVSSTELFGMWHEQVPPTKNIRNHPACVGMVSETCILLKVRSHKEAVALMQEHGIKRITRVRSCKTKEQLAARELLQGIKQTRQTLINARNIAIQEYNAAQGNKKLESKLDKLYANVLKHEQALNNVNEQYMLALAHKIELHGTQLSTKGSTDASHENRQIRRRQKATV